MKEKKVHDTVTMRDIWDAGINADDDEISGKTYIQSGEDRRWYFFTDGGAGIWLYDTFARASTEEPFRYLGRCPSGSTVNMDPDLSRKMFVCSRYAADTEEGKERNLELARAVALAVVKNGYIPEVPHLLFTQFLDDSDPADQEYGRRASLRILKECGRMLVAVIDGKISEGMRREIEYAIYDLGIDPEYLFLTSEEADGLIRELRKKTAADEQSERGGS